jgi:hypothetical protein
MLGRAIHGSRPVLPQDVVNSDVELCYSVVVDR